MKKSTVTIIGISALAMLACFTALSCTDRQKPDPVSVRLPDVMQPDVVPDTVGIYHNVSELHILKDSLLLMTHSDKPNGCLVSVSDLNRDNSARTLIEYGESGLMSCVTSVSDSLIVFTDPFLKRMKIADADELFTEKCKTMETGTVLQYVLPYNGHLLGLNPNCFTSEKYGIKGEKNRFIQADNSFGKNVGENSLTFNVVIGSFIVSKSKNRVVYFDSINPEYEIYDYNLSLIRTLEGPDKYDVPYYADKVGKRKTVAFYNCYPAGFGEITYNEKYIYALYWGCAFSSYDDYLAYTPKVIRMDWDGNIIDYINVSKKARDISASVESQDVVYVSARMRSSDMSLLKYEFPGL